MRANEIKVGGLYTAKVSGKITTVRVDEIHEVPAHARYGSCRNGRKTTFRSAAKFRGVAESPKQRLERAIASVIEMDA